MSSRLTISFAAFPVIAPDAALPVALAVFVSDNFDMAAHTKALLGESGVAQIKKAATAAKFKGKAYSTLDIYAPTLAALSGATALSHLIVVGVGGEKDAADFDYVKLGGVVMGKLGNAESAGMLFDLPTEPSALVDSVSAFAEGASLRAYKFDDYKSKKSPSKKDGEEASEDEDADSKLEALTIHTSDVVGAQKAYAPRSAIVAGTLLARDLVNEPPNMLYPASFAAKAKELEALGVGVEVLGEKELTKLGFGALLAVGQGSRRESHVVIMRWNGTGKKDTTPLAIIGKGVCFDTGGISIKPAASMEVMKGDMAGAACVVGLMHALAARKAKAHVVGAIGLVENMPDGNAYRPGDILTSLSGQTIEVINTDAEGRLVLADVLWHIKETVKPSAMIDLATLTGAILVALGQDYAGLFSNNDELSDKLLTVGKKTGEKLWRMPLDKAFDKMIDSKFADMKNTGGRYAGSSTAAQFLQRFVGDVPWAHLDVAGTAMAVNKSDINHSWAPGFGVRLLDKLVADYYEG